MTGRGGCGILIVGGGFTGAAIAYHLTRSGRLAEPVRIVEPRPRVGHGLAYGTNDPVHRINVPASRMSLIPDATGHFTDWIARTDAAADDPQAVWSSNGSIFPQRGVFGRYVADHLAPAIENGRIRHIRASAAHATRDTQGGWRVTLDDGRAERCDLLILAASHPPPAAPPSLAAAVDHPAFVPDPYRPDALGGVAPDAAVLIVGSGLTAADMIASLSASGHRGTILCLSRNGLRSRGHTSHAGCRSVDLVPAAAQGALALSRAIRRQIALAAQAGEPWQWVMDHVRETGPEIWQALSPAERIRLVRHLRTFWDVHRFRIAPQPEALLDERTAAGTFRHVAGRILDARPDGCRIAVDYRLRADPAVRTALFDCVINTTGPSHAGLLSDDPFLSSLAQVGALRLDPTRLGLHTSLDGHAIGSDGTVEDRLLVAGPLARGTFGELMGLPEVSRYALQIARRAERLVRAGHAPKEHLRARPRPPVRGADVPSAG